MKSITQNTTRAFNAAVAGAVILSALSGLPSAIAATTPTKLEQFTASPPLHVFKKVAAAPSGITPAQIKAAYGLPATGGKGTIAIIGAYDSKTVEKDLETFSKQFNLPACSTTKCFEKHLMDKSMKSDDGWALEAALDVEWAHAIAPAAKILLVEAKSATGPDLMKAVDYARGRKDVVAISMSWGGSEFSDELKYETSFKSDRIAFFASSGDSGSKVSWPASSPNVIGVGGTTLTLKSDGSIGSEKAWAGSGGGVSKFEAEPAFQSKYDVKKAKSMRAVPDVAYNADPKTGFAVYKGATASTTATAKNAGGWYQLGGTSAGAPQWAGIQALGGSITLAKLYADKNSAGKYFRDITSGKNGSCTYYCVARKNYDYVTGLGSPLTSKF